MTKIVIENNSKEDAIRITRVKRMEDGSIDPVNGGVVVETGVVFGYTLDEGEHIQISSVRR